MFPELEKPRVTEIQVRMDCNGCVRKIKKALHGINGIYELNIDFPQQKLTIIGWADPEKIVKAIKKTKRIATICSHTVPTEAEPPAPPTEQAPQEGGVPTLDAPTPPPPEAPQAEASQPTEPSKDPPAPPENPPAEATPLPPTPLDNNTSEPTYKPSRPKDNEEVHVIHHHPPDYGYRYNCSHRYGEQWQKYQNGQGLQQEHPQPVYVTHSYNTYKPSPYVTEYEYVGSPPRHINYSRMDRYAEDYHNGNNGQGNIASMFSDENPNACRIM